MTNQYVFKILSKSFLALLLFFNFAYLAKAGSEKLGPGISGGGDFKEDATPTAEEIIVALREAEEVIPFVWNAIEYQVVIARAQGSSKIFGTKDSGILKLDKSTFSLLFPWPSPKDDVFTVSKKLKIKYELTAPCIDGLGNKKALSAFPLERAEICVSVSEILKTAKRTSYKRKLVALLAHEISHKMGVIDEPTAELIENEVESALPVTPFLTIQQSIKNLALSKASVIFNLRESLDATQTKLNNFSRQTETEWTSVCFHLGKLSGAARELSIESQIKPYLLNLFRPNSMALIAAFQLKSSYLDGYCSELQRDKFSLFKGKSNFHLAEHSDPILSLSTEVLNQPAMFNLQLLKNEISELKSLISTIEKLSLFVASPKK